MHLFSRLSAVLIALCFVSAAQALPNYSNIYVFGDSLSDNGNAIIATSGATEPTPYAAVPSLPYDTGNFTNGSVWSDYLAGSLGLSTGPSLLGGNNFAIGGARSVDIDQQVNGGGPLPSFVSTLAGGSADSNALYALWGGGNDIRDALFSGTPIADLTSAVSSLGSALNGLALAGATKFMVLNAPDIGLVPAVQALGASAVAGATNLSVAFNSLLNLMLDDFEATFSGITLGRVDIFGLLHEVVADPAAFGLTNTTDSCLVVGASTPCTNASDLLFWDGIHVTTAGHAIVATRSEQAAISVTTLPVMLLLMAGLMMRVKRQV